jgi:biopolymer transport protein ExbD
MHTKDASLPEPELNATPLIDVLLVLLTMLILTVPVITHAIKLDMPAGGPAPPTPRAAVDLDIDSDGRVFWNGTGMADDLQLETWLQKLAGQESQPDLKIWPDKRGRYGRVAQVMAAAQRSGVQHIALAPTAP